MRLFSFSLALFIGFNSLAFADVTQLWSDLCSKRKTLVSYHQDLERVRSFSMADHNQTSRQTATLDGSGTRWRDHITSGSGDWIFIFDGSGLFQLDASVYTREKRSNRHDVPEPELYDQSSLDLKKGVEVRRIPCGLKGVDHPCIVMDFPVKGKLGISPNTTKVAGGLRRVIADSVTGLFLFSQTVENRESRNQSYRAEIIIRSKQVICNEAVNESQFHVPAGYTEVKELPKWNAERIKKELAGKPAPELALLDINGKPIKLSELKGRTVLLEFWATWCGPCRADAPSLDKLFRMYGEKTLSIIGLSVDEDHETVRKFLGEHPHAYSIALTTENEMPRAYQVGVFPTYVVIDPDGNFADATEGDSGFYKLKKLLKRAGMETD